MSFVQLQKIKTRINAETDIEKLRDYLLLLVDSVERTHEGPDNYSAMAWNGNGDSLELEHGTKEMCIGYCRGVASSWYSVAVVCGEMIVWPKDHWGFMLADLNDKGYLKEED